MEHNDSHPLPPAAYAVDQDQSEVFFDEARHLLMLAADKLTAAGVPGQLHHELEITTPEGDFARFIIDYAHEGCDIVETDIGLLARRLVTDHGYDYAIDFLEQMVDDIDGEADAARHLINSLTDGAVMPSDMEHPGDYQGDYFELSEPEQAAVLRDFYRSMNEDPEVASDTSDSDDRFAITPMGSQVLEQYRSEEDVAVAFVNSLLVMGGEEPLTAEEEALFRQVGSRQFAL